MIGVTKVTYQGDYKAYDFVIVKDGDYYLATCDVPPLGGINTQHKDVGKLVSVEIPDAVRTWEHK